MLEVIALLLSSLIFLLLVALLWQLRTHHKLHARTQKSLEELSERARDLHRAAYEEE